METTHTLQIPVPRLTERQWAAAAHLSALLLALLTSWLVCSIVAAVKAWDGEEFRYPLSIRLVG